MRWPWKRKPKQPEIPPFRIENFKPLEPKDVGMVVEESELSQTGMWRLFKRKPPE